MIIIASQGCTIMPFVLINNVVSEFKSLRKKYEAASHIDLDHAQQPYAISCFFGAKDVDTRKNQIVFIEKWLAILSKDLSETGIFDSNEARERHIKASRILITVGIYISLQIDGTYKVRSGSSATLTQIINTAMGITHVNNIDEETRACCLLTTKRFLSEGDNASLIASLTDKEWHDFLIFISNQCDLLDKKYVSQYPITSITMPLCAKPLELAGYATGFILGDSIGRSNEFLPARYALTVIFGSCVIAVTGPSASVAVMLFASGRILDTFCGISLAWLMGTVLKTVGQGVGLCIGIPLDLGCKLLYNATRTIGNLYSATNKLNGISLIDGSPVVEGITIKLERFDSESLELVDSEFEIISRSDAPTHTALAEDDNEIAITVTINGQSCRFPYPDDRPFEMRELEEWMTRQSRRSSTSDSELLSTSSIDDPVENNSVRSEPVSYSRAYARSL